jgi:hypothetical protein
MFYCNMNFSVFGRGSSSSRRFKMEPGVAEATPAATSLVGIETVTAILLEVRQKIQENSVKLGTLTTLAETNAAAIKDLQRDITRVENVAREQHGKRGVNLDQLQEELEGVKTSNAMWARVMQTQAVESMDILLSEFRKVTESVNSHTDSTCRDTHVKNIQELGYLIRRECKDVAPTTVASLESKLKRINETVTLIQSTQSRLKQMVSEFQRWTRHRLTEAEINVEEDQPTQGRRHQEEAPAPSSTARDRYESPPRPSGSTASKVKDLADRHNTRKRVRGGTPLPNTPPLTSDRLVDTRDDYSGGLTSEDEILYSPPLSPKYVPTSPTYRPDAFSDSSEDESKPIKIDPPRKKRKGSANRRQTRSTAANAAVTSQEVAPVPAPAQEVDPGLLDEVDEEPTN